MGRMAPVGFHHPNYHASEEKIASVSTAICAICSASVEGAHASIHSALRAHFRFSVMELPVEEFKHPLVFAEALLGLSLYRWQDKAMVWYRDPKVRTKGSIVAPNGSGKDDRVIACLALWYMTRFPRSKVVITSKDSRQLDEQTMSSMRKHAEKLGGWKFQERYIESPTGSRCIMFTTDEAGRAEGWHKEDDEKGPLLIIVNEAKSVPNDIFEAFDRCTFNGILYISSAGLMQGRFYDSHTKEAASFQRQKVTLDECPHMLTGISGERVRDVIANREQWFIRSTLYSEFINQDENVRFMFDLAKVQDAMRFGPVYQRDISRSAFCDFAAGGDENVLAVRDGNRIDIVDAWRERDTMSAVGRFILKFRELRLTPEEISGDAGGMGIAMINRFHELGWPIRGVNNNGKPRSDTYKNLVAEMWGETAAAVSKGLLKLPDDPILQAQLTTRPLKIWSDGKTGLMSKEDMQKAGISSPDRADAVCGAYTCRGPVKTAYDRQNPWSGPDEEEDYLVAPPGMHAG